MGAVAFLILLVGWEIITRVNRIENELRERAELREFNESYYRQPK